MTPLRLAWSLIRIPRLFASLLLFPVLLGVIVIVIQLAVVGVVLKSDPFISSEVASEEFEENARSDKDIARRFLFGTATLPRLRICRWKSIVLQDGRESERPTEAECRRDRLDVAIQVTSPESFDAAPYAELFEGNAERLHLCRNCKPDIVITPGPAGNTSRIYSVWGLIILALTSENDTIETNRAVIRQERKSIYDKFGHKYLHLPGVKEPLALENFYASFALIVNLASLVVVSLWLALKAHRRVLDYFARNGALLPMVAASGRHSFYLGIWLLTVLRVGAFLMAAVPLSLWELSDAFFAEVSRPHLLGNIWSLIIWIVGLVCGFALATVTGSIADLKQRHSLLAFSYRYLPLLLSAIGALLWAMTFIFEGAMAEYARQALTALPVAGLAPMIMAPLLQPPLFVLAAHGLLSCIFLFYTLTLNARWFAAHLEEL